MKTQLANKHLFTTFKIHLGAQDNYAPGTILIIYTARNTLYIFISYTLYIFISETSLLKFKCIIVFIVTLSDLYSVCSNVIQGKLHKTNGATANSVSYGKLGAIIQNTPAIRLQCLIATLVITSPISSRIKSFCHSNTLFVSKQIATNSCLLTSSLLPTLMRDCKRRPTITPTYINQQIKISINKYIIIKQILYQIAKTYLYSKCST